MGARGTSRATSDSAPTAELVHTDEWDDETAPVSAVVTAVAAAAGTDPVDLPPLYDAIDPDALNALYTGRSGSDSVRARFRYADYTVIVEGSGEVRICTSDGT